MGFGAELLAGQLLAMVVISRTLGMDDDYRPQVIFYGLQVCSDDSLAGLLICPISAPESGTFRGA
jgi:hypothetical protein